MSFRPQAPVGEPHYRDHWAGRRFTPGFIAPTQSAVWVAESLLPLLARIDPATGAVTGPFPLARPERSTGEAHALVATEGAVWVRWDDGVTRFDPTTQEERSIEGEGSRLAVGLGTVWTVQGGDRIARLDAGGRSIREVAALGEAETRLFGIACAHGAVWTLAWTDVLGRIATLSRRNPETGGVEVRTNLSGSPQSLTATKDAIWARLWRGRRPISDVLVKVDAQTAEPLEEIPITPTGAAVAVGDDGIYLSTADPFAHDQRGLPSTVVRVDPETGKRLVAYDLPGRMAGMVPTGDGVWGKLERRDGWRRPLIELRGNSQDFALWTLDEIDISQHLPAPPRRIDARETEQKVRDGLAAAFFGGLIGKDRETGAETRHPYIRGVEFEDVRLEGEFPDTTVVVLFRSTDHPGITFGRRRRIWEDDGAFSSVIDVMDINLMEDVEACGYGLPSDPRVDESGIAWV